MSDTPTPEKTPTGEHAVTTNELKRSLTWHDIRTIGTIVVSIFVGGALALQFVSHEARAQADAGLETINKRTSLLERQLAAHEAESQRVHLEMKDNLKEVQADIRALYKAVMTKEPQARLERDGGTP